MGQCLSLSALIDNIHTLFVGQVDLTFIIASSPGPTKKSGKGPGPGVTCKLPRTCVCAKSAYYTTHPNNHIIDSLHSSRASALRNVIIGNGQT